MDSEGITKPIWGETWQNAPPDLVHVGKQRVERGQLLAQAPSACRENVSQSRPREGEWQSFRRQASPEHDRVQKRLVAKESSAFYALLEKILLLGDPVLISIEE